MMSSAISVHDNSLETPSSTYFVAKARKEDFRLREPDRVNHLEYRPRQQPRGR